MKRIFFIIVLLASLYTNGQVYILNEDFSTATSNTPPAEWLNYAITGLPTDLWNFGNSGNRTINYPITSPFAIFDAEYISNGNGTETAILETPYFDASIGNYTLLLFDHLFSAGTGALGKIQAFNGTAWVDVITFSTSTTNPKHEVIDLSAICAGKSNAKLRFRWEGDGQGF
jgi:hypothetical protein